jgi:ATP-dependent RNA helicase HelY
VSLVDRFAAGLSFPLDRFQSEACAALEAGRSVLVCAPTGAGKTIVGEFGVYAAIERGGKAFFTTPLKALSNQKFGDFIARYGAERVGLLTGDNSINGDAPVVVMTTEVLRNMLYERSDTLTGLQLVVMDEVHYLKDQYRGATWEEVLIHLPAQVRIAALSATVSNSEEFGEWIRSVRGPTAVVVEATRPVPIEHVYMAGPKLHPMFLREGERLVPNPSLRRAQAGAPERGRGARPYRGGRRGRGGPPPRAHGPRGAYRPDRIEVVERLRDEGMLPAIVFIFSRAGCAAAVEMCRRAGVRLTNDDEAERIREYVAVRTSGLPEEDHEVLGFEEWADALERGIASHHAGLIPLFKETVEELFERALCKVVFATETLSLGINMPAKTVVLEKLMKFNGERHEMLTPADYTQLTGRAGRRGMDPVGFGVTLLQPDIAFDRIASLAEGRSFPISSSFRPSYNMAVNLLQTHSIEDAERLLNLSFAQFLADRGVVRQQREIERKEKFLDGYRHNVECDRGDFVAYWKLLQSARAADKASADRTRQDRARGVRETFARLRPGQVVRIRKGPRAGLAAIVEVRTAKGGEPLPVAITADRRVTRLAVRDFREAPEVVGAVELPRGNARAPRFRHDVGEQLLRLESSVPAPPAPVAGMAAEASAGSASAGAGAREEVRADPMTAVRAHPAHACPERAEHEKWMRRIEELETEVAAMRQRVRRKTETLARTFERVRDVLQRFGYVDEERVTAKGKQLARIYNESDLLVAEALTSGLLDNLDEAGLAVLVSTLVFETRIGTPEAVFPSEAVRRAFADLRRLYVGIADEERRQKLELVREPDPGFIGQLHQWARGADLETVLAAGEMSAGDFVRATKQVWDLLRQLAEVADEPIASRARGAARAIYRGVVAYSGAL